MIMRKDHLQTQETSKLAEAVEKKQEPSEPTINHITRDVIRIARALPKLEQATLDQRAYDYCDFLEHHLEEVGTSLNLFQKYIHYVFEKLPSEKRMALFRKYNGDLPKVV